MIKKNSVKAWILAARPKTLAGAAVPVLTGCSFAYSYNSLYTIPAILCFLFAFLMQIDANLINDLFDYLKGCDNIGRLGPERACAQGWITPEAMKKGIALTTVLACITGLCLLFYGGTELIAVGALCVLFAFLYTAGPYPLAYHGWGDLLVIIFFGIIPAGCTFYIMTQSITIQVFAGGFASGLVVDTLLMVNNYRDREQDAENGKRTLVVILGEKAGGILYLALGISASLICLSFLFSGNIPAALLPQLYLIPHYYTWKKMLRIKRGTELNAILAETSRNMMFFALLLSSGLLVAGS